LGGASSSHCSAALRLGHSQRGHSNMVRKVGKRGDQLDLAGGERAYF
jgi:hypothetical protein